MLENKGQVNEASNRRRQKSQSFSPDLAKRINDEFMGALPDSTSLSELYKPGGGPKSQGQWHKFLQQLEIRERVETSAAAIPLFRAGYSDIGSVRKAEIEELCEIRAIGPKKAAFIKEVFKAKEVVSETKNVQPAGQSGPEPQLEDLYNLPFIHNPLKKSSQ